MLEERKAKSRQRRLGHHATAIALSRGAKMHEVLLDGARRDGEIGDDNKISAKLSANEGLFDCARCLLANVRLRYSYIRACTLTKISSCDDRSAALLGLQDQLMRLDTQRLSELFENF